MRIFSLRATEVRLVSLVGDDTTVSWEVFWECDQLQSARFRKLRSAWPGTSLAWKFAITRPRSRPGWYKILYQPRSWEDNIEAGCTRGGSVSLRVYQTLGWYSEGSHLYHSPTNTFYSSGRLFYGFTKIEAVTVDQVGLRHRADTLPLKLQASHFANFLAGEGQGRSRQVLI